MRVIKCKNCRKRIKTKSRHKIFCKRCRLLRIKESKKRWWDKKKESPAYSKYLHYRYAELRKDPVRKAKYKARVAAYLRRQRLALRKKVIKEYGGKCICCGEKEVKFLTIDHQNGDGSSHRQKLSNSKIKVRGGYQFFRCLKRHGFPKDANLAVMCYNCHMAKDHYGECPHKSKK